MANSKFFSKGISTPVGIFIIVLCAILAGGILTWQYFGVPKEEVKAPGDETADWKTYRNEEYGFEMKYPGNWEVQTNPGFRVLPGNLYPKYGKLIVVDFLDKEAVFGTGYPLILTLGLTFSPGEELEISCFPGISPLERTISGFKWQTIEGESVCTTMHGPGSISGQQHFLTYQGEKEYYFISYLYGNKKGEAIINQMLSTFRFLE